MKFPLVRRKALEELERTLRMVNRALECELVNYVRLRRNLARSVAYQMRLEKELIRANASALEEQGRADQFQKRCEAYEDAARRSGLHFQKIEEREVYCMKKYL